VEEHVQQACHDAARRDFGIEIVSFGVTRLGYPAQNLQSVFARMRAERERIARAHRSEGKAAAQKIRAEADRERATSLADADAEARRLIGEGEAEAARVYAEAYGGREGFYGFLRTLESYEKVLRENATLVLPADSPFLELLLSRRPDGSAGR
jgi:membrane protease subunit HflC